MGSKKSAVGGYCLGKEVKTMKYVCEICGYVYDEEKGDPEHGVAADTKWDNVPKDWSCPLCGVGKENFQKE